MKEIEYDVYIRMTGQVWSESEAQLDFIDAVFPDGYEGVIEGISTNVRFADEGYIRVVREDTD